MAQETEINIRTLLYEINTAIYACDLNSKILYANLSLASILGFDRSADILGKNLDEFLSPENGKTFINQFRNLLSDGKSSPIIRTDVIRQDGTVANIEIMPMPFIKDGVLIGSQGVIKDITEQELAERKTKYISAHDPSTGLYNQTFFEMEMDRLERGRQFPISIILVSAEFENHREKEKLLKHVAHTLFNSFRGDDIVSHIGKNEFAILLPGVDEKAVINTLNRIKEQLKTNTIMGLEPVLEFNFGVSTANKGEKLLPVLKQAKTIVYLAKKKKTVNE